MVPVNNATLTSSRLLVVLASSNKKEKGFHVSTKRAVRPDWLVVRFVTDTVAHSASKPAKKTATVEPTKDVLAIS